MLPLDVSVEDLDPEMKELVVNLNRIPQIHTLTNCGGEIWRETPAWPTKDGWLYFIKPEGNARNGLVKLARRFCDDWDHFDIGGPDKHEHPIYGAGFLLYDIGAHFESHENGGLLADKSAEEIEAYYQRAEERKEHFVRAWADLNEGVVGYLKRNVSRDVDSLPFVDEKIKLYEGWRCPHSF